MKRIARSIINAGAGILSSRVLGFVRDMLLASVLGAGIVTDALLSAIRLAMMLRRIVADSVSESVFVPQYMGLSHQDKQNFASYIRIWYTIIITLIIVLMFYFQAFVLGLWTPGFNTTAKGLVSDMLFFTAPYMLFGSISGLYIAMLSAYRKFFVSNSLAGLINISMIVGLLLIAYKVAFDVRIVALSFLIGGIIECLMLRFTLSYYKIKINFVPKNFFLLFSDKKIIHFILKGARANFAAIMDLFFIIFIMAAASFMPAGTITCFLLADRLINAISGIIGVASKTVLLTYLSSSSWRRLAIEKAVHNFNFRLSLPACVGIFVFAEPLVRMLFFRGAFDLQDVERTAVILKILSLEIPFIMFTATLGSARYARHEFETAWIGSALMSATAIILIVTVGLEKEHITLSFVLLAALLVKFLWLFINSESGQRKVFFSAIFSAAYQSSLGIIAILSVAGLYFYAGLDNRSIFTALAIILSVALYFATQARYWLKTFIK